MMDGYKLAQSFVNKKFMDIFETICQRAIDVAVERHKFDSQSYNLENSFSYAIYHNGKMMKFQAEGSGQGAADARTFCDTYNPKYPWSAVIVAGAWYAGLIEGYVRRTEGERAGMGETLTVLSDAFNFVSLEWIRDVKRHATK